MTKKSPRSIVIDPVCEMDVRADSAPGISFSGRRTYFFCSSRCKQEFDRDPAFYLDKISRSAVEARNRYAEGKSPGRRQTVRRTTARI